MLSSRYEARGKFGEHERCVRVALGYASSKLLVFFLEGFVADVMSVDNRNMKHARAIEFDYTNLLDML